MAVGLQQSFDDVDTPLSEVTFVVVDVETTGGSPATASLTEVAAARYRCGELLGTYQTLVRPDAPIPPFITALTGISDAMVVDAPRVGEMLPSFLEFLGGAVVVGHNVRFDLSFLNHALESTGRERLSNDVVDTLALSRRLVRDMVPNCRLGTLAASLHLPHRPSHRALADVLATGDLLHALIERAGSFGIVGLDEFLVLPRLVGHPQSAKLRLTNLLPRCPGVYWFSDAAGHVLYVGMATDLHSRVRSYFSSDSRTKTGRLLQQMHRIDHRVCSGPLVAAVLEGRLIRAWDPPFNQQGKARRSGTARAARHALPPTDDNAPAAAAGVGAGVGAAAGAGAGAVTENSTLRRARRGGRPTWTVDELEGDPIALLAPFAARVRELAGAQRYEDAAGARDEAERLRRLLHRHRRIESFRRAGRVDLLIDGEVSIELDGGLLTGPVSGEAAIAQCAEVGVGTGHEYERRIVARWLTANAERVRIVHVDGAGGLAVPAWRIPELAELCGGSGARPGVTPSRLRPLPG